MRCDFLRLNKICAVTGRQFNILFMVLLFQRSDSSFSEEEGSEAILTTTKDYLLRGLVDENKELRSVMNGNYIRSQ